MTWKIIFILFLAAALGTGFYLIDNKDSTTPEKTDSSLAQVMEKLTEGKSGIVKKLDPDEPSDTDSAKQEAEEPSPTSENETGETGKTSPTPPPPGQAAPPETEPAEEDKEEPGLEYPYSQANDFGAVGAMNHQYLQGVTFEKLIVEIDTAESANPSSNAVNNLVSTVKEFADKPGGIVQAGTNSFNADQEQYTLSEIKSLSQQNRNNYSSGDTAVIHILYLNGSFADNSSALGIAYNASSIAIFPDQIAKAVTALVLSSSIERAVVVHELGHLLGLVNLTYQSDQGREDANHPGHSGNKESVMYWAVEDISVANVLRLGPPYRFDTADRSDIEKIKSGIY
jgi:hypothetical protein